MSPRVHPTAIIDRAARIDESCEIGPYCVIEGPVVLGPRNKLKAHVHIEGDTVIGSDNFFAPFVSIGGAPQSVRYKGEPTRVRIGSHNTFKESVTIHRGTPGGLPTRDGVTTVGDSNFIMAYCHIAHDCVVQNEIIMANSTQLAGHVTIEDQVRLGGANLIVQHTRVGTFAFTGAGSVIRKDVIPYCLGSGEPVFKPAGINRVGLERAGVASAVVAELKRAFHIYFDSNLTHVQALETLKGTLNSTEAQRFIRFLETSTLGVHR